MPRKNNGDVPHGARGKALAYLRGELPRGYHGAAEKTIRDALGANGSVLKFNQRERTIEVYRTFPNPNSAPDDVVDFSIAEEEVKRYFERQRAQT